MGENENGFTQGITPDDIFLVRPTGDGLLATMANIQRKGDHTFQYVIV